MEERRATGGGHIAPIVYFAATATTAAIMFVATVVAWLTEAIGSLTWATLIVGSFFLFVAWLIYVLAVRRSISYFRDRLDTIYDVAHALQNGYKVAYRLLKTAFEELLRR